MTRFFTRRKEFKKSVGQTIVFRRLSRWAALSSLVWNVGLSTLPTKQGRKTKRSRAVGQVVNLRRIANPPLLVCLLTPLLLLAQDDTILKAMRDELTRSMSLKMMTLEAPYYIEYQIADGQSWSATATLGGLIGSNASHFRIPRVHVRVGDYNFDNTNYVARSFQFGGRQDAGALPLEDNYSVLRRYLWLATDQTYKSALEQIARKRAALRNVSVVEEIPDFGAVPPVKLIQNGKPFAFAFDAWRDRARTLSAAFTGFPKLRGSGIEINAERGTHYFVNSEGTEVRIPENGMSVWLHASAQAPDGMIMRDGAAFYSGDAEHVAGEPEMMRAAQSLARSVTALAGAPVGETYSGPILFEGIAGAQIFAEILGKNLALTRKPVTEPGFPGAFAVSELEGRQGARILPEFFDVVDDPTQTEWRGRPLFGSYPIDEEGVKPQRVAVIEKGVLKNFLLTRQPIRGFAASNGHARLPGNFGASNAAIGNLFVRASETMPISELRKKMMEICAQRNKPYGIVVRKMDYPSTAPIDEVRRILSGAGQSSGSRPVSLPIQVYRLYPDGREELVRGLRFRGLNARSFKDVLAAGDDSNVFEFLDNGAPFALIAVHTTAAETTVIAPSILIDDLELHKIEDELPKLPIVPPPTLTTTSLRLSEPRALASGRRPNTVLP